MMLFVCFFCLFFSMQAPKIYWEQTSSRVLCMEYMDGCHVTELDDLDAMRVSRHDVAKVLCESFSHMTFVEGLCSCVVCERVSMLVYVCAYVVWMCGCVDVLMICFRFSVVHVCVCVCVCVCMCVYVFSLSVCFISESVPRPSSSSLPSSYVLSTRLSLLPPPHHVQDGCTVIHTRRT
jgi:ABC1 atypical kinase-like domain